MKRWNKTTLYWKWNLGPTIKLPEDRENFYRLTEVRIWSTVKRDIHGELVFQVVWDDVDGPVRADFHSSMAAAISVYLHNALRETLRPMSFTYLPDASVRESWDFSFQFPLLVGEHFYDAALGRMEQLLTAFQIPQKELGLLLLEHTSIQVTLVRIKKEWIPYPTYKANAIRTKFLLELGEVVGACGHCFRNVVKLDSQYVCSYCGGSNRNESMPGLMKEILRKGSAAAPIPPRAAPATSFGEVAGPCVSQGISAPTCPSCGHVAVRNGACYKCLNCGESLGCS
ncbi:MAG: hypothetical protein FJY98_01525 [Candidatus Liptonbacteria bacterium]|nr:hypothetical protein [Candidatus Liptonbacteria bacterium]